MNLKKLSDDELITRFSDLLIEENEALVVQLEYFAELDRRKLFYSYDSLWAYLIGERKMDEPTAERKIRAARLMTRFPWIKGALESGKLNLSLLEIARGVARKEKLSDEDLSEVLHAISGMSCRRATKELASMYPHSSALPKDRIISLTEELSEVRFVAHQELLEKIEEMKGMLAHSHPGASLGELFDIALTEFRKRHHPEEKAKRAKNTEPNRSPVTSRVPSQPLVHALVLRDGYRCSYQDEKSGRRCDSKHGLQIDHIKSWSRGGRTELKNLRYLCANHHRRVSFLEFGESARYFAKKEESG